MMETAEMNTMKVKTQRYPAYKDSGEGWIGEIPQHWEVRKLKHIFTEKKAKVNMALNCGSISFGKVVMKDDEKIPVSTKASYQEVLKGEFLINPLNLNYDLISLRIGLSYIDVVVSAGYIVLKAIVDMDKEYFKYLLHRYDVAYMKLLGSGVRQTISFNHISNSLLLFPPLDEQTRIAEFLDRKTAHIDQAIAQKERQIELLKERRQILIQNAVTRGLNPNVKMKDSGVEWIGEIPEHWEVKKLKYYVNMQGGFAFNSVNFKSEGIQLLKIANTYMNTLALDRQPTFLDESFLKTHSDWVVSQGDILMSLTGTLGKTDYGYAILINTNDKYLLNQRVARIKAKSGIEPEYIVAVLQSDMYLSQLYMLPAGTKQANLSNDDVLNIKVAFPKAHEERLEIMSYLGMLEQKTEKAVALKENEIEKLKEYKTTLINAAVTGKIKV